MQVKLTMPEDFVPTVDIPVNDTTDTTASPANDNTGATANEASNVSVNNNGQLSSTAATTEATNEDAEVAFEVPNFDLPKTEGDSANATTSQTTQPATITWQDALKTADKKEVLKHLGLSDFQINLEDFLEQGGNPHDFFQAKAINWDKLSDEAVVKMDFKEKYPKLDDNQINRLIARKYKIGDEIADEQEREDAQLDLQITADEIRVKKSQSQASFKFPEARKQVTESVQQIQPTEEEIKNIQKLENTFRTHTSTKTLTENKRVAIGLGEGIKPINFSVNPELVWGVLFDDKVNSKFGKTESGEPDVQLAYELALFRMNPSLFKKQIYQQGFMAGHRKEVDEGQNAAIPSKKPAPVNTNNEGVKNVRLVTS